ncbi:MAG TPA: acyl-CoA dehydrogenase [Acidimicrobiales bacterium]|nr:acyl-CoA dehydrogenase [Acidimicrobiales bacterium]
MPIGIGEDHEELRRTVRRWLDTRCPPSVPRALLDAETEDMPAFWDELAAQGWLGMHVAEEHGGQGFGMLELAVVAEEMARAVVPGPVLPTMLVAALVAAGADDAQRKALLAPLVEGRLPAALAMPGAGALRASRAGDGSLEVRGSVGPVLGAGLAAALLAPVAVEGAAGSPGGAALWCLLDLDGAGVSVRAQASLDLTRRVATVEVDGATVPAERQVAGLTDALVRDSALVLGAAECAGGARWCLETASEYAVTRRQFGRPIGQFQAVKHRLADMLVMVEQTTALAWDAAQAADAGDPAQTALSAVLAGAFVLDAYLECAKGCIQLLGGMGFTWEHDAHLHLRRALSIRQLLGPSHGLRVEASRAALAGSRRRLAIDLPEDAAAVRAEIRAVVAEVAAAERAERRDRLVDTGLLTPHWPAPWGRGAGPVEQLVIDEELAAAHVHRPHLAVGAWALPTIIAHGTAEQQERWVGPTLRGAYTWCQLFSEPGAGSDLAALSTRATRTDGGWVLNGQKVWTSIAMRADWGICLARTDPDAPKHEGITYFIVDMHSGGIEVRPLREITGDAMFNEVFFTDVFVPDDCVVGPVNGGWRLARTTLANERVSMASGATFGFGIEGILRSLSAAEEEDAVTLDAVGALLAEAQSVALLGARTTLRSVSGVEPGPEASVRKLLGAEHEQRVQELGLSLLGARGATTEDDAGQWSRGFLSTRCLTIAGGTSEVQRNVIGERILGLPRDPEPGH